MGSMNKFMTAIAAISCAAGALALEGCSDKDKSEKSYRYQLTANDKSCDTGLVKANSQVAFCQNLADESLNKGCAIDQREKAYTEANCTKVVGQSFGDLKAKNTKVETSGASPTPSPSPVVSTEAPKVDGNSQELSYNFFGQGCETGLQVANSVKEYCELLADEKVNRWCAQDERLVEMANFGCEVP